MKRKPKKKVRRSPAPAGLAAARQVRKLFGWSERTLERNVERGLPVARAGRGGRPSYYDLSAIEKWARARQAEEDEKELGGDEQATSIWTEKWREERYRALKRQNDVAEGRLFEGGDVRKELAAIFGTLRAEFEALGRTHGPAVADGIREAIERAEIAADKKFPEPAPRAEKLKADHEEKPVVPVAPVAEGGAA